jgi:MYXO-CTERM domain-containing protein
LKCTSNCTFDTSGCNGGPQPDASVKPPDSAVKPPDASKPPGDTGSVKPGDRGTGPDGSVIPPRSDGCNCQLDGTLSSAPLLPLLSLGLLLALVRRRRR